MYTKSQVAVNLNGVLSFALFRGFMRIRGSIDTEWMNCSLDKLNPEQAKPIKWLLQTQNNKKSTL